MKTRIQGKGRTSNSLCISVIPLRYAAKLTNNCYTEFHKEYTENHRVSFH